MVHIVKIYFKADIRRIAVTTDTVNEFRLLKEKVQSLFQFPNVDSFDIKWLDSEGDYILITSNDELAQAVANADDLLRLYVCLRDQMKENFSMEANREHHPKEANNNEEILHPMVICDNCDKNISGFRYKCLECWDYDLCSSCNSANVHSMHDMIKLARPTFIARKWLFVGADRMWKSMFHRGINKFLKGHFGGKDVSSKAGSSAANPGMNRKPESEGSSSSSSSSTSSPTTEPKIPHGSEKTNLEKDLSNVYETFKTFFPETAKCENLDDALEKLDVLIPGTLNRMNLKGFCSFLSGGMNGQKENGTNPAPSTSSNTPQTSDASATPDATKVTDAQVQASTEPIESASEEQDLLFPGIGIAMNRTRLLNLMNARRCAMNSQKENGTNSAPSTSSNTPDASSSQATKVTDAQVQAEPMESSMEIGTNQTPIEVEDDQNIDEIVIDPENGTTQVNETQSSTGEGWTLLEGDFTSSRMDCAPSSCGEAVPKPTETVVYPNVMDVEADQASRPAISSGDYIQSLDPRIRSAVITMQGMGFSNEGGWLERLLISKNANINETLEALYPSMR